MAKNDDLLSGGASSNQKASRVGIAAAKGCGRQPEAPCRWKPSARWSATIQRITGGIKTLEKAFDHHAKASPCDHASTPAEAHLQRLGHRFAASGDKLKPSSPTTSTAANSIGRCCLLSDVHGD